MPTKERRAREAHRFDEILSGGEHHARYHRSQSDPSIDTAAKRLARRAGCDTVRCPCGAEFPAEVRRA